jgi:hypothetical protein
MIKEELKEIFKNYEWKPSLQAVVESEFADSPEFAKPFEEKTGIQIVKLDDYRSDSGDHDLWFYDWHIQYKGYDLVLQWYCTYHSDNGIDWIQDDFAILQETKVIKSELRNFVETSIKKLSEKELEELVFWRPENWHGFDDDSEDVDGYVSSYATPIEQLLYEEQIYTKIGGKEIRVKSWKDGVELESVEINGGDHDGQARYHIVRFGDVYICFEGWYSSWGSDDYMDKYYQVFPKKNVIENTIWEKVE